MRCIYLIKNLINEKVYVGQTKNFANRKAGHLYAARKGNKRPLYHSIRKHGKENFLFEVIENDISDGLINDREQFWVSHYDSFNLEKGYNLTSGGGQGSEISEETKRKIGEANKHRIVSEETRRKISKSKSGENNTFFGKKHTEETRQRMSTSQQGENNPMFGKKGDLCPNSKLTRSQTDEIRLRLKQEKIPLWQLGAEYNVSRFTISRIRDYIVYS